LVFNIKTKTDLSEEEFYEISQYYKEFNHEDEDESFEEFIKGLHCDNKKTTAGSVYIFMILIQNM
jgi:hypothetical protein